MALTVVNEPSALVKPSSERCIVTQLEIMELSIQLTVAAVMPVIDTAVGVSGVCATTIVRIMSFSS